MAGESLIAVKDAAGNWGYCDQSGALVIPCIYQPQMSLSIMNETIEYPYADLSGMVVVKTQSGQKLVLDVYGNEIISAGQYEDLAPRAMAAYGQNRMAFGACCKYRIIPKTMPTLFCRMDALHQM